MNPKQILIVAPFTSLPGEKGFNRFRYISEKLSDRGHKVYLITSNFIHSDKKFRDSKIIEQIYNESRYNLILLNELGYKKNVSFDRIRSHKYFERELKNFLNEMKFKPDIVYAAYPLIGAAEIAGNYAKEHNIPFLIDVQDVWPESINSVFRFPEPLIKCLLFPITMSANRVYRLADYILGVSETYVNRAKRANKKAKVYLSVFIGTDIEYFDKYSNRYAKDQTDFWLTYIGTLSYSYDISTVIKATSILRSKGYSNIVFNILGSGPHEEKLKQLANKLKAPVRFLGHMNYEKMIPYLVSSDIAMNAIAKGAQQSITNKIGDFLAAGLPILNSSQNKEFMHMVESHKIGINYNPGNVKYLVQAIEDLYHNEHIRNEYGKNARRLAENQFDRSKTYLDLFNLIESI